MLNPVQQEPKEQVSFSPDGAQPMQQDVAAGMQDTGGTSEMDESQLISQNLEAHLNQLPDDQKQFLAEHLTPEFVRAIGIINGPEVAEYLNQFADPNKVLVPVPRQMAEQYLAEQQASQQGGAPAQPQGQPVPAQPQAAPSQPPIAGPQGGMMSP